MQNRNGFLVPALIGGIIVLMVLLLGAGVWTVVNQMNTREKIADIQATMEAQGIDLGEPEDITTTVAGIEPTLVPTPTEADAQAAPTEAATPTREAMEAATPTERATDEAAATPTDKPPSTGTTTAQAPPVSPPEGEADWSAALAASSRDKLAANPDAPVYTIGARFDPEANRITGSQTILVTNAEDAPLSELYLRMYPNALFYRDGGIEVSNVTVADAPAQTALEADDTVLVITLPQPLAVGAQVEVALDFVTTVPDFGAGYGIFGVANGVYSLYNWHPELAVYENGAWLTNPVTEQGDPTNTDVANYYVSLTTPDDVRVVTSGIEDEPQTAAGGEATHMITSSLTRNFVMVLSDRLEEATQQVGDVVVNSYYLEGDEEGGKAALASAARSVEIFSKAFGPYAYPELDVAEVKLGGGAAGMESTGLILIGSDLYGNEQADMLAGLEMLVPGAGDVTTLDFVTAHEVGHQWWYGVVGSNAYEQPWLDESLTNWSSAYYMDEAIGPEAGLLARDIFIGFPYQTVLQRGDERLDAPVDAFSEEEYSAIVYGKGALMYDVLRQEIGDERFWAFLRDYYTTYQFERADGAAWQEMLAKHTDEATAQAFVDKWVEGSNIREDDLPPGGPMRGLLSGDLSGIDINKLIPTIGPLDGE